MCGHHFPVGAEERVEQLADPGSFRQFAVDLRSADPLAFTDLRPYTERLSEAEVATGLGDAMVVGTATIEGMPCVLCTMDFAFMGGSMGSVVGEMFTRASDVAAERGIPLVSVAASGGARMQENVLALMQMAKTVCAVDLLRESGVPYVSVLAHPDDGRRDRVVRGARRLRRRRARRAAVVRRARASCRRRRARRCRTTSAAPSRASSTA